MIYSILASVLFAAAIILFLNLTPEQVTGDLLAILSPKDSLMTRSRASNAAYGGNNQAANQTNATGGNQNNSSFSSGGTTAQSTSFSQSGGNSAYRSSSASRFGGSSVTNVDASKASGKGRGPAGTGGKVNTDRFGIQKNGAVTPTPTKTGAKGSAQTGTSNIQKCTS